VAAVAPEVAAAAEKQRQDAIKAARERFLQRKQQSHQ
jgi:hypothetical protein